MSDMQNLASSGTLSADMKAALEDLASMGDMKRLVDTQGKQLANLFMTASDTKVTATQTKEQLAELDARLASELERHVHRLSEQFEDTRDSQAQKLSELGAVVNAKVTLRSVSI